MFACDYVSLGVCFGGWRLINCLCTYRQQPEPRPTRWEIRYDTFPEKGEKKRRDEEFLAHITSSLHRKMRECQWGLTPRHPSADQSIADITPRHVEPLPVLKLCITNEVLLGSASPDTSCLPAAYILKGDYPVTSNLNEPHFTRFF